MSPDPSGFTVIGQPKLDLELYIQNYSHATRFSRLLHVGTHCKLLSTEALKSAVNEAKTGVNVSHYLEAWDAIRNLCPDEPEAVRDEQWIADTTAKNEAKTARLEKELKGYKNNLIKDSIRMGNEDLGRHYESIGAFNEANEAYTRMRQDISLNRHANECTSHIILVAIQRRDWGTVMSNANKFAAHALQGEEGVAVQHFAKLVTGIANMCRGDFELAARSFLQCQSTVPANTYGHIASPNDIAVYSGLLSLVTMDRQELQIKLLDSQTFRPFLEMEPNVRKAVGYFVNGRYSQCLALLESFRSDYMLDIYMYKHVSTILAQIRAKCIVQYFTPFSVVTIDSLNGAFGEPEGGVEHELVDMIREGVLKARIDAKNKLLIAVRPDSRFEMQQKALNVVHTYEAEAKERLRRISIISGGLEVPQLKRQDLAYAQAEQTHEIADPTTS